MKDDVYLFSLCSPDARFPNQRDWYLRITWDKIHQIAQVFDRMQPVLDLRFGYNRHYFNQATGEPASDLAQIFHPTMLSAGWLTTAFGLFSKYEELFVGSRGQMFPARPDTFIIHSEKSSPVMEFPKGDTKEYITINQWEGGAHFYLESSIGRIFPEPKYDNFSDAYDAALKVTDSSRISVEGGRKGKRFFS